jgi:UDP-N-acetylmuramoyl-tripeptide--D-alanyl-D-alanine ligase
VLNGDDPHVRWMAEQTTARVVTFGFQPGNDVRASELALDWPHGTRFRLEVGAERRAGRVRLLGRHQVYAALAALAVSVVEGVELGLALDRLEALEPTPGRLEPVQLPSGAIVLRDDYKSSFETIEAALEVFREVPTARRLLVLGEIQEPPASVGDSYRRIGELAASAATRVLLIGSRDVRRYRTGLRRGGLAPEAVLWVQDLPAAVEALRRELRAGDALLLKGTVTQRLERVLLQLEGRTVRCTVSRCPAVRIPCHACAMLERGWEGVPIATPRPRRSWSVGSPGGWGEMGRGEPEPARKQPDAMQDG